MEWILQWLANEAEGNKQEWIEAAEKTIAIFDLTPEICTFLVEKWGWSEIVAILVSMPLAALCIIIPIITITIVTKVIGKIIRDKIRDIFQ